MINLISRQPAIFNTSISLYTKVIYSLITTMANPMEQIKDVDIDTGRFKYILIKVEDKESSKFIVRGYQWASYHANIFEATKPLITELGLKCNCVGGGRILHNENEKAIKVFGYSQGFGRADHQVSVDLIKKAFADYKITWSNGGY